MRRRETHHVARRYCGALAARGACAGGGTSIKLKENLTIKVSAAFITSVSPFTPLPGGNPLLGHQPSSG
jgi:hypothetical protein